VTLEQFATLLENFDFTRRITEVHMHHTSAPNHAQWRDHESVVSMFRHHTQVRGFSDIAQHITITPDGDIFLGRNWNRSPASAVGFNGTSERGPFMFEMVGDFNAGRDPFQARQRRTALQVVALVQKRFDLPVDAVRFHREMSNTDCPGGTLTRSELINAVDALRGSRTLAVAGGEEETESAARGDAPPFSPEHLAETGRRGRRGVRGGVPRDETGEGAAGGDAEVPDTLVQQGVLSDELRTFLREFERAGLSEEGASSSRTLTASADEEDQHDSDGLDESSRNVNFASTRASGLTLSQREALRPHLVNLNQGRFSDGGEVKTTRQDVDALFDEHLERYLADRRHHPDASERKVRLLFWAHGGLVSEASALKYADAHRDWWLENGVYPLFFVWETGFFETVGQLLRDGRSRATGGRRDIFDFTTDPVLETLARRLGGVRIWGGMKLSAERAAAPGTDESDLNGMGGGRYVARKLAEFCNRHAAGDADVPIELFAVGHSAGAIFHAHFLPAAAALGAPAFRELHLLAPAIRVDEFKKQLVPLVTGEGAGVQRLTLFTMNRLRELDDHCAQVYRKSLLYLIHFALEPERREAILGLEESLRADNDLRRFFGLGGALPDRGSVVFSPTGEKMGRSATSSLSHGGFDEDPPTLESIARRALGLEDADPLPRPYPRARAADSASADTWNEEVDLPEEVAEALSAAGGGNFVNDGSTPSDGDNFGSGAVIGRPAPSRPPRGGDGVRRVALCVGINSYANAPLRGCVADAQLWAQTLGALQFETRLLLDRQATREAILSELRRLVAAGRPGDVLIFQYSGHGTTFPDRSGDERDGDTPLSDEALCPVDIDRGAFLLDDDLSRVLGDLPDGVALTLFMDCCHSGSISRFAAVQAASARSVGDLSRLLPLTDDLIQAHQAFRQQLAAREGSRAFGTGTGLLSRGPATMREALFSACRSDELAWESNGQGDYTRQATALLHSLEPSGVAGLSNAAFHERVVTAFGAGPRQRPQLDCAPAARSRALLQPLTGTGVAMPATVTTAPEAVLSVNTHNGNDGSSSADAALAAALEQLVAALRRRG